MIVVNVYEIILQTRAHVSVRLSSVGFKIFMHACKNFVDPKSNKLQKNI